MGLHILAIVLDNASPNDVLVRTVGELILERYGIPFHAENGQIRCIAHVVNLVVQKILKELLEINEDPDDNDYFVFNKHLPIHYDPDEDEDVTEMEGQDSAEADAGHESDGGDEDDDADEVSPSSIGTAVKKVRDFEFLRYLCSEDCTIAPHNLSQDCQLSSVSKWILCLGTEALRWAEGAIW